MTVLTLPIVMQDGSEVVDYDQHGIPLYIRKSSKQLVKYLPHWHDDLEFIVMLSGNTLFHVNEKEVLVRNGDCFFVKKIQKLG